MGRSTGQNLGGLNEGWIEAGSEIEVLERVPRLSAPQRRPEKRELVCGREPLAGIWRTFWFEAADSEPPPDYLPGQHLPISLDIGQGITRVPAPLYPELHPERPERYSISVKKPGDGRLSPGCTMQLQGDRLLAAPQPASFTSVRARPACCLSAGSGVTPCSPLPAPSAARGAR